MENFISGIFDEALIVATLIVSSFTIRYSLGFCYQNWVNNFHQTASIFLLPIISFTITRVIAGDLALSLGMVGALSIVRFRNPVKSPLELVTFFALITVGISASVSLKWSIMLTFLVCVILISLEIVDRLFIYLFKKKLFNISFEDGNNKNTIEITSSKFYPEFNNYQNLLNYYYSAESNIHNYIFTFDKKNELAKFHNEIKQLNEISEIKIQNIN